MVDERFDELLHTLCADYRVHNNLNLEARTNSNIKRGLRNDDGTGVMVGCTAVGNVLGYTIEDGERVPMPGRLIYRGYDLSDLVDGYIREQRFGFPEVAYLLLFGHLPDQEQYDMFKRLLHDFTDLPQNFTEDMILKNPSHNVMNKLGRSVLALYSCDPDPDSLSVENMMRQSIELIARFPVIAAYAYVVKRHYFDNDSLYLHRPEPELSTAENFLRMIRPDKHFTQEEARLLDLCLVCHAEHGGGNNSTFTCRSVSSTGTDTYSAIAAAVGSLKGPKHGGANRQVLAQFSLIKQTVRDWKDDDAVADCVGRILRRELGDGSGLIYGMGHAVYTLSDPRTVILRKSARTLAAQRGMLDELELMEAVERVTPRVFAEVTGHEKVMCANVDMYSGLVYTMLDIPEDVFTPLFASARIAGWCANRMEEVITMLGTGAGIVAQLGVFLFGAYLAVTKQGVTPGVVIVFLPLMSFVVDPIGSVPPILANRRAAVALIDKLADAVGKNVRESGEQMDPVLRDGITIDHLTYGYHESAPVLNDVSVRFEAGKSYAIVGTSGSGKSTLVNLLMGSSNDYQGSIRFDQRELRSIATESLYGLVSVVQQNVFIFDDTIRNNITMFRHFDEKLVQQATEKAGLTPLLAERGEDYICGEGGSGLSGGERQRISIARCLLRQTPVLLIDEATAALDAATAYSVSAAILAIEGLTRIVVTHRLEEPLLRKYDEILVLKNGEICERGSFDALMARREQFYSLFNVANG